MAAIDFPSAPALDQEVELAGITYVFNGTGWVTKPDAIPVPPEVSFFSASGALKWVSRTELSFKPHNGNLLQVNGKNYAIPDAGVPGLTNAGLAGATLYYVYVYDNAGALAAEFSTTGHATSATPGNSGTEIKIGDDTRTLIGMIYTGSTTEFYDESAYRFVRTWFNDTGLTSIAVWPTSQFWAGAGWRPSGYPLAFLSWANEWVSMEFSSSIASSASAAFFAHLLIDNGTASTEYIISCGDPGFNYILTAVGDRQVAEGYHIMNVAGDAGVNGFTFYHAGLFLRNTGSGA